MARHLLYAASAAAFVASAHAATVTYDMKVEWVTANPDGMQERPVIGVNGQWPPPIIRADVGDNIVVNLENQLGNQSTSAHFHGLYQVGTPQMDGPVQVTQCDVPPGSTIKYNFTVNQPGEQESSRILDLLRASGADVGPIKARIGTTLILEANIRMVSGRPLSSTTRRPPSRASMMRRSYFPSPTGITTRCRTS